MNDNHDVPAAVMRVAEIASLLAEDRPSAKQLVKELFARFAEIQEHYRRPQRIETALREPDVPLQLFCPDQGGWHYGEWCPVGEPGWVATIDDRNTLYPTHWRAAEPPAMSAAEISAWMEKRTTAPVEQ